MVSFTEPLIYGDLNKATEMSKPKYKDTHIHIQLDLHSYTYTMDCLIVSVK